MRKDSALQPIVFAAFLCIVIGAAVAMALGFTPTVRSAPLVVGIPTLALICIQLYRDASPYRFRRVPPDDPVASEPEAGARDAPRESLGAVGGTSEAGVFLWLAFLCIAVFVLGFLAGSMLFVLAYLRLRARERWPVVVATILAAYAAFELLFVGVLNYSLYEGYVRIPVLGR